MRILTVEEAQERVLELCTPLPDELVSIDDAIGRTPAQTVLATRTLPPHDCAAADGYAIRVADVKGLPTTLTVIDRIQPGQKPSLALEEGSCARVAAGAHLPAGADAVVPEEHVQVIDEEQIEVLEVQPPGANLRRKGEEMLEDEIVLAAGTRIGLGEAGRLWSQGLARLTVRRRPVVAIATAGEALCNAWEEPRERTVDVNSPMLAQAVKGAGGQPLTLGVVADRGEAIAAALRGGLSADVLITVSGGEMGSRDSVRHAFAELGMAVDFWAVAMQPGGLLAVGRADQTLILAFPGNSFSALVYFELFGRPALRALQGLSGPATPIYAKAAARLTARAGLRQFLGATVTSKDGVLWAKPLASQAPQALASLAGATHLISLESEVTEVEIGSNIELIPVNWGG